MDILTIDSQLIGKQEKWLNICRSHFPVKVFKVLTVRKGKLQIVKTKT